MKDTYIRVLDKGFVGLKDWMGSDEAIEQSARVSYGAGTRKVSETRNLLRYLMRHHHTSVFEQAELKFHIKLPLYVNQQLLRHRTANINQVSHRYSIVTDDCHEVEDGEWRLQSKNNKQGSDGYLTEYPGDIYEKQYDDGIFGEGVDLREFGDAPGYLSSAEFCFHDIARTLYNERLAFGIAREQARKDLPLSTYTELFWKIDLHNLFHFLKLRLDEHAQLEIREYAQVIAGFVKELFPISWEAFEDYQLNSVTITAQEDAFARNVIVREDPAKITDRVYKIGELYGLSKREVEEYYSKLKFLDGEATQYDLDLSQKINIEEV